MFERFTDRARRAVVYAQDCARERGDAKIGLEHVLLGLLYEGQGIAGQALARLGMELGPVEELLEELRPRRAPSDVVHVPFSGSSKQVLELGLREALAMGHNYIGTEHLALGLARAVRKDDADMGAILLARFSVTPSELREAVLEQLRSLGITNDPEGATRRGRAGGKRRRRRRGEGPEVAGGPGAEGEPDGDGVARSSAAQAALDVADDLAGGGTVGTHHLLAGLLRDPGSAAAAILAAGGFDTARLTVDPEAWDLTGTTDDDPVSRLARLATVEVTDEGVVVSIDQSLVDWIKDNPDVPHAKDTVLGEILADVIRARLSDPVVHERIDDDGEEGDDEDDGGDPA